MDQAPPSLASVFVAFMPRTRRHIDEVAAALDLARHLTPRVRPLEGAKSRLLPADLVDELGSVERDFLGLSWTHGELSFTFDYLGFLKMRSPRPVPLREGLARVHREYFLFTACSIWRVLHDELLANVSSRGADGECVPLADLGLACLEPHHQEVDLLQLQLASPEEQEGIFDHYGQIADAVEQALCQRRDLLEQIRSGRRPAPAALSEPSLRILHRGDLRELPGEPPEAYLPQGLRFPGDQFTAPFITGADGPGAAGRLLRIAAVQDYADKTYEVYRNLMDNVDQPTDVSQLLDVRARRDYENIRLLEMRLEQARETWNDMERDAAEIGTSGSRPARLAQAMRHNFAFVRSQYEIGRMRYEARFDYLERLAARRLSSITVGLSLIFLANVLLNMRQWLQMEDEHTWREWVNAFSVGDAVTAVLLAIIAGIAIWQWYRWFSVASRLRRLRDDLWQTARARGSSSPAASTTPPTTTTSSTASAASGRNR